MVQEDAGFIPAAHDYGPQLSTDRCPDHVRRRNRNKTISGLNNVTDAGVEVQRIARDAVVDGKVCFRCTVEFVRHDILAKGHGCDGRHTWTEGVVAVGYVVDDRAPRGKIGAYLMDLTSIT